MIKKVLVIDDSASVRATLQEGLTQAGMTVTAVENGKLALDWIKSNPVDLIICDLNMPVMNGFHVLGFLKSNKATKDIPIIISSTESDENLIKKLKKAGCELFLIKPIDIGILLSAIKIFDKHQAPVAK